MKLIVAVIPPHKLDDVRKALVAHGIVRVTIHRVTGHGQASAAGTDLYRGAEVTPDLHPKVRLEIAVNDTFVEPTIEAIIDGSRSGAGQPGDGKIFVLPLEECIRIRTGERGSGAI
jgi:nitrogen regulatory protein PII